tara:strand:+ start:416 stop:1105 length:690 start_codon:yes stop_codon:yes gene_type:complete
MSWAVRTVSAIRNPTELTADTMRAWSSASLGSRIVVTGTSAKSLEELSNHPFTPFGTLLAIETVLKVRGHILTAKLLRDPNSQSFSDAQVVCFETIREFMDTLEHTIPLSWIHLGHGDYGYEKDGEDDDDEWGDVYAMLSDGEDEGDWIRTEEISKSISESKGKDSMLFCILPVCRSSHSGDVLQSNRKVLAIHATELGSPHDGSPQLLEMQHWEEPSRISSVPPFSNP